MHLILFFPSLGCQDSAIAILWEFLVYRVITALPLMSYLFVYCADPSGRAM